MTAPGSATAIAAALDTEPTTRRSIRRRRIIDAATDLFLAKGYSGVSLDEIVAVAGGSKSTIYAEFGNKEGLFAAVVDSIVGEIVRPLPDAQDVSLGLRDALLYLAREHASVVLSDRHAALIRLVAAEVSRLPEIGKIYYETGPARGHTKLEAYLASQVAEGLLRIDDIPRAAEFFWGMLLHKWTLRRLYMVADPPDAAALDAICQATVDAFLAQYGA